MSDSPGRLRRLTRSLAVALAICVGAADRATSQPLAPASRPSAAPSQASPPLHEAARAARKPPADQVLLPTLRGLIFVAGKKSLKVDGVALKALNARVSAPNLPLLQDKRFKASLSGFLDRPLRSSDLSRIIEQTQAFLQKREHPFVAVTAPPQNITSGVVQLVVTEFRISRVSVKTARYFSPGLLRRQSGLNIGQTLSLEEVKSSLARLNQNPFLSVTPVFHPSSEAGGVDVDLDVADRFPVRIFAGYDNQGVPNLGLDEFQVGAAWGDAFGDGQILSYQYNRSVTGGYQAHSLSDTVPLSPKDSVLVFGAYERETPAITQGFNDLGSSAQAGVRYIRSLPTTHGFSQDLQVGYDFKTTNNNLAYSGYTLFGARAEVDQFPLIYDGAETDPFGQTALQNTFVGSPGGLTGGNTTRALSALSPGSEARYVYDRVTVTRTTLLPFGLSAITQAVVQRASANLADTEELSAGGSSVRGYYTNTALGSDGALFSQEIRFPAVSPSSLLPWKGPKSDLAQTGVFFDYADLKQVTAVPDLPRRVALASAGVDLRYTVSRFIDVRFDLGWRLRPAPGQVEHGSYGALSVVVGF